jgi:hypothetical protein
MYSINVPLPASKPVLHPARLLDQVRERIRHLHYSLRTEEAYLYWIREFIRSGAVASPPDNLTAHA